MLPVVGQPGPQRALPSYLATTSPVEFGEGFFWEERDRSGAFRWMAERGCLRFAAAAAPRYLELTFYSEFHDLSQWVEVDCGGARQRLQLAFGWTTASVPVPPDADRVEIAANKIYPPAFYPGDGRRLSVNLRPPILHRDPLRHGHIVRQHRNVVLNRQEMLAKATVLSSTPVSLGIDMHGVCNVKPPCVYCEWDTSKTAEGDNVDKPFTRETLDEYGEFFAGATNLVNCSIGEPFMMKNLDGLLDAFGDRGKFLEVTTNGQILTDRNIEKLLGRPIHLYISLDSGTPETYAKLRNDRFDAILANLRRLIAAKGGRGAFPHVYLVFMPMPINAHEIEDFVRICAELGVDRAVLRPLNDSPAIDLDWERAGDRFRYQDQLLPFPELIEISGRAAGLAERYGVELIDQLDFGEALKEKFAARFAAGYRAGRGEAAVSEAAGSASPPPAPRPATGPLPSLGAEQVPICDEPWKSLYILRRGVYPCCYGGHELAPMDDYRAVWNSQPLQEIRGELAAGRLHGYCRQSPACPIVRKMAAAGELSQASAPLSRLRRGWNRLDLALNGLPKRLYRPFKPLVARWVPALRG